MEYNEGVYLGKDDNIYYIYLLFDHENKGFCESVEFYTPVFVPVFETSLDLKIWFESMEMEFLSPL